MTCADVLWEARRAAFSGTGAIVALLPLLTKLQIVELSAKDRRDTCSSQRSTRSPVARLAVVAGLGERVRWYDEPEEI